MKKKAWFLFAMILIVVILIMGTIVSIQDAMALEDDQNMESYVKVLTENIPTHFFVLGKEMNWPEGLKLNYITELSEKSLTTSETVAYRFLVINDFDGSIELTKQDLKYLKKVIQRSNVILCYYGAKYTETLNDKFGLEQGDVGEDYLSQGTQYVTLYYFSDMIGQVMCEDEIYTQENMDAEAEKDDSDTKMDITEIIIRTLILDYKTGF